MKPAAAALDPWEFLRRALDRAHALVLLAPALFLVWPGPLSPIAGDPFPIPTSTGVATVAATLAIALLITRRVRPQVRWVWAYLGFVAAGYASLALQSPSDSFGASRATLLAAVCLATLVGGASLAREGRAWLSRGLVVLSLAAVIPACLDVPQHFAGLLGNSGSTSEVALLGAALGAWLALNEGGPWRWLGALAAGLYALYVGLAPVFTGAACFAAVLAVLVALKRYGRAQAYVLAAACAVLFVAGRMVPHPTLPPSARPAANAPGDVGGLAVRRLIWGTLPAMALDYGVLGTGPGQFQAAYPPYRDPREVELSSHERTLPQAETEVEHAHSDVLQAFVEYGWVGGALWLVFLGAVAARALKLLRTEEDDFAALAAAALAVLGNALWREPLLWNPASASAAFAVFGVLLSAQPGPGSRAWARGGLVVLAIGLVALNLARGWSMAWHGRALNQYVKSGDSAFSDLALDVCEDSAVARAIAARQSEERDAGASSAATVAAWQAVLAVRPHNLEALMQLGVALAKLEQPEGARTAWTHALTIDPGHPSLRRNLARMEALVGDVEQAEAHLRAAGIDVPSAFAGYGVSALRELRIERGWELLGRSDPRMAGLSAELAYSLARAEGSALDDEGRQALEGSAHLVWARQHGAAGDYDNAVRSYRQAKRCLAPRDGHALQPALALELAGALAAAGRVDEARTELGERELDAARLARLPEWAGQALFDRGLLSR